MPIDLNPHKLQKLRDLARERILTNHGDYTAVRISLDNHIAGRDVTGQWRSMGTVWNFASAGDL